MAASVLFDNPGPKTVARHRIYTIVALLAIAGLIAFVVYRLWTTEQLTYEKWEPFVTPTYMQALLIDGVLATVKMAALSILFAVVLGALLGIGKMSDHGFIRWPCWAIVEFFRAIPLLLLMVFIFFLVFIRHGDTGSYWSVVIALALYNGAVLAEIVRAGVLALPKGQAEAAYAIGMRKSQVMSVILLPQAVKIMIPAIVSQCVVALKDTSLGYAVGAPGLTKIGKSIFLEFHNAVPTMFVLAFCYISLNLILTGVAHLLQRKLVGEKKPLEVSAIAHGPESGAAA